MQHIAQALPNALPKHTASPTSASANAPPKPLSTCSDATGAPPPDAFLRRLWERMTALYGHTWTSAHGISATRPAPDEAKLTIDGDTWQRALFGLTGQQFAAGIEACIVAGGDWPPSAPRFRAMCFGIPSMALVKREWDEWRVTPFTRLVHQYLDGWLYRQSDAAKADRLLRDAYEAACQHVMAGGELPEEPAGEIEHVAKEFIPASRETVAKHCAEISKLLRGGGE